MLFLVEVFPCVYSTKLNTGVFRPNIIDDSCFEEITHDMLTFKTIVHDYMDIIGTHSIYSTDFDMVFYKDNQFFLFVRNSSINISFELSVEQIGFTRN